MFKQTYRLSIRIHLDLSARYACIAADDKWTNSRQPWTRWLVVQTFELMYTTGRNTIWLNISYKLSFKLTFLQKKYVFLFFHFYVLHFYFDPAFGNSFAMNHACTFKFCCCFQTDWWFFHIDYSYYWLIAHCLNFEGFYFVSTNQNVILLMKLHFVQLNKELQNWK